MWFLFLNVNSKSWVSVSWGWVLETPCCRAEAALGRGRTRLFSPAPSPILEQSFLGVRNVYGPTSKHPKLWASGPDVCGSEGVLHHPIQALKFSISSAFQSPCPSPSCSEPDFGFGAVFQSWRSAQILTPPSGLPVRRGCREEDIWKTKHLP